MTRPLFFRSAPEPTSPAQRFATIGDSLYARIVHGRAQRMTAQECDREADRMLEPPMQPIDFVLGGLWRREAERKCGNGVVAAQAAVAFSELWDRLHGGE